MDDNENLIISLYKINYPGPYVLKIFNDIKKEFQIFGEVFMLSNDLKFYNKDGTGPWEDVEVKELQDIVDDINSGKDKTGIKAYFEFFDNRVYKPYTISELK